MNRILVKFTPNTELVPFNNQVVINSYINEILGPNNPYHGKEHRHSFSILIGGSKSGDGLTFKNGAYICVTALDEDFIEKIIVGVLKTPKLKWGMEFNGIEVIDEKFYDEWNHFVTLSPFILRDRNSGYKTFNDADFNELLTKRTAGKIKAILPDADLTNFEIILTPPRTQKPTTVCLGTKMIRVGNHAHISLRCNAEIAKVIYALGIGEVTGSMGLGSIYKSENASIYRK